MIDTLKLLVPVATPADLDALNGVLMRFRKEDLKTGEVKFEFHSANLKLGSYERNVSIKTTVVPLGLFVECSFPKFDKGNNVEMIHPAEIQGIANQIHKDLCTYLNYSLLPTNTWTVYRLDICYNWIFKSHEEARGAIDFIKRIDYPRKKKYTWDTSLMYKGSAYIVKFYLKGDEFYEHEFKEKKIADRDRALTLMNYAERMVRFEVGLKHQYLKQFLKKKKIFLNDISDDAVMEKMLVLFLGKVFFYINTKSMANDDVWRTLNDKFSPTKAFRLFQFYKSYFVDHELKDAMVSGGLNRSTIYRYKKELRNLGVGFNVPEGKGILEQLIIPSGSSQFSL